MERLADALRATSRHKDLATLCKQYVTQYPKEPATAKLSPATNVTYRHYCVRQYLICRDRWGDSWQFSRCMQWRGCWEAYLDFRDRHDHDEDNDEESYGCSRWREACAENWGYGNSDYYGCLRYHGCE
jgi:hypothetical protein